MCGKQSDNHAWHGASKQLVADAHYGLGVACAPTWLVQSPCGAARCPGWLQVRWRMCHKSRRLAPAPSHWSPRDPESKATSRLGIATNVPLVCETGNSEVQVAEAASHVQVRGLAVQCRRRVAHVWHFDQDGLNPQRDSQHGGGILRRSGCALELPCHQNHPLRTRVART